MTPERTPVLYFRRCGWCGAYEGKPGGESGHAPAPHTYDERG